MPRDWHSGRRGRDRVRPSAWCQASTVVNVPRFIRRWFRAPYDGLQHFAVVDEGALYRSGQPTPEQIGELIARYRLRTVISLRGSRDATDPDAWEVAERAVCLQRNVKFLALPCNHRNPPTAEQVEQFLQVARDPARLPALVHCRIGQQRTGLFCALYRMHVMGMAADDALREMDAFGFESGKRRHRALLNAFYEFSPNGPWRPSVLCRQEHERTE